MSDEPIFKPMPEGPPRYRYKLQSKFDELYEWLEEHPGEWSVVERMNSNYVTLFKKKGYEATSRRRDDWTYDIWVRKPVPPSRRKG